MEKATLTKEYTVTEALTAEVMGSGDMPVLATPALIAFMENTAMLLAKDSLEEGTTTVGTMIRTDHRHPTPVGETVRVTATLTAHEGRKYSFSITAEDSAGTVAEATHERVAVTRTRFLQKIGITEK